VHLQKFAASLLSPACRRVNPIMKPSLTTGDAAKELNVSAERVRQLEREGVLRAVKTKSGMRIFSASEVEALRQARAEASHRR
jgi:excisionase family DNA binding protein